MEQKTGTLRLKIGLADMLKGGVIMDVVTPEQAKIAEDAGAVAVMALERVPADIRAAGGVARMADPEIIEKIIHIVSIPVMANHVDKFQVKIPFVCGARDLGEALRRIGEGAALIRTKGEAGTGNIVEAVRHMRKIQKQIRDVIASPEDELMAIAKGLGAPFALVTWIRENKKLPVPNFAAGGIATPADASLMMQLGAESVFVGSGIFKSSDPPRMAKAIVEAVTYYNRPDMLAQISKGLGEAMPGLDVKGLSEEELLQVRGW
jgi:pyridoxal 5'-phosphate synthase pdxS subunit